MDTTDNSKIDGCSSIELCFSRKNRKICFAAWIAAKPTRCGFIEPKQIIVSDIDLVGGF